jgi:hypothetical protein
MAPSTVFTPFSPPSSLVFSSAIENLSNKLANLENYYWSKKGNKKENSYSGSNSLSMYRQILWDTMKYSIDEVFNQKKAEYKPDALETRNEDENNDNKTQGSSSSSSVPTLNTLRVFIEKLYYISVNTIDGEIQNAQRRLNRGKDNLKALLREKRAENNLRKEKKLSLQKFIKEEKQENKNNNDVNNNINNDTTTTNNNNNNNNNSDNNKKNDDNNLNIVNSSDNKGKKEVELGSSNTNRSLIFRTREHEEFIRVMHELVDNFTEFLSLRQNEAEFIAVDEEMELEEIEIKKKIERPKTAVNSMNVDISSESSPAKENRTGLPSASSSVSSNNPMIGSPSSSSSSVFSNNPTGSPSLLSSVSSPSSPSRFLGDPPLSSLLSHLKELQTFRSINQMRLEEVCFMLNISLNFVL